MDVLRNYVKNQWDRVGAWVCVVAGALALLVGWVGVSGTPETWKQIPYVVSGGLVGLFLLGLGAMLWISADLRDEWRKLDAIDRHLAATGTLADVREGGVIDSGAGEAPTAQPAEPRELSLR
jgi:protein-S-isoprenylcysteine O-methyltransferase Ste14